MLDKTEDNFKRSMTPYKFCANLSENFFPYFGVNNVYLQDNSVKFLNINLQILLPYFGMNYL